MRIFRRSLKDEGASLLAWAVVLVLYGVYAVSSFQSFGRSEALDQLMANLPAYMRAMFGGLDWGTIDGWLNTEVFSFASLLIAFYAGLYGGSALAREVDARTVESVLAQPVQRWSLVLGKFGTMVVGTLLLNLALALAIALSLPVWAKGENPSTGAYFLVSLASYLTALGVGSLCLFVSALLNEQRKATVYASGLVILLYFVNVIGQVSQRFEFLSSVNPFGRYHSADIIRTGAIAWSDAAFLLAFALVFLAAAVAWFGRKDLA